ncbi:uncharacterized protein METZ01_LOCUS270148, partial [marine metagenome]
AAARKSRHDPHRTFFALIPALDTNQGLTSAAEVVAKTGSASM